MLSLKKHILQKKKNQKGFTLVEIIVVLLMLAILASIAIPTMLGYVEEARYAEDYGKIRVLNTASSSYEAYTYTKTGEKKDDIFDGITTDEARQNALLARNYIDEIYYSSKTGELFVWNIKKQVWEIGDGTTGVDPKDPNTYTENGTILDGLNVTEEQKRGEWDRTVEGGYKIGDLVTYNGVTYKLIQGDGSQTPGQMGMGNWKKMDLVYDYKNYYQANDIIKDSKTGNYYRMLGNNNLLYGSKYDEIYDPNYYVQVYQNADGKTWTTVKP